VTTDWHNDNYRRPAETGLEAQPVPARPRTSRSSAAVQRFSVAARLSLASPPHEAAARL